MKSIAKLGLILAIVLSAVSSCFAPGRKDNTETPVLIWRHAYSNDIIFTSNDIILFDRDKQIFHLTEDAALDFWGGSTLCPSPSLVVEDEDGPIYKTCGYHPFSSVGCRGTTYGPLEFLFSLRPTTCAPFILITNGFPPEKDSVERVSDPRFAPRLKAGLEKAGVISSINLDSVKVVLTSLSIGSEPKGVGEDLKVWVIFVKIIRTIPEVRFDRKAHATILFAGGEIIQKEIDELALDIKLIANNGTYRSDARIDHIPVDVIEDGRYVCEFAPWQPVEGSDKYPESGSGLISMTILFQKDGKNVYRLEIPDTRVSVIGRPGTK